VVVHAEPGVFDVRELAEGTVGLLTCSPELRDRWLSELERWLVEEGIARPLNGTAGRMVLTRQGVELVRLVADLRL